MTEAGKFPTIFV